MDDPLRVLRVNRFASKLGYAIDGGAQQSMEDERIHAALNAKISRERVGIEVVKMMNSRNPLMANPADRCNGSLFHSVPRPNQPVTSNLAESASPPTPRPPVAVGMAPCLPSSRSVAGRHD